MLLLSLMACLESAKDLLSIQVDVKKDVVHVHWVMQDVADHDKCGPESPLADCVAALKEDLAGYTDGLKGTTQHTEGYVVTEGRLDFVLDYTAPTSFFATSDGNQVQQVHMLTPADLEKGAPGKPGVAVLFENDPNEKRSTVKATGNARLLRMPQKNNETFDVWLIEKGKAAFEAEVVYLKEGQPMTHGLLATKPGLLEAMKAEKLL